MIIRVENRYLDMFQYDWKDPNSYRLQHERQKCCELLTELYNYSKVNYKKIFTIDESDTISRLLESDLINIELARQIILERLNK